MNTVHIKPTLLSLVPALGLFILVQACGGSDPATAQEAADPLEGAWESVITARDCTSSAAVATFRGLHVFHRGGTLSETNGNAPTTRGPGVGTWTRSGSTYIAKFRFFTFDTAGVLTGTQRVTRNVTLSADGNTANGTTTAQALDLSGTVTRNTCATDVATRAS